MQLHPDDTQPERLAAFRLSPQQEHLWSSSTQAAAARTQLAVLVGGVEPESLHDALAGAVARHEALRTTFLRAPGTRLPGQVVNDRLELAWTLAEHGQPALDDAAALADLLRAEAAEPLDLEAGPVFRAFAAPVADGRTLLVLTAAAACADAQSLLVVAREACGEAGGDEPLQHADYAEWRHELAAEDGEAAEQAGARALALAEAPGSPLPFQSEGSGVAAAPAGLTLEPDVAAALRRVADGFGADLDTVLQAAWLAFLCRISGVEDALAAVVVPERGHPELAQAVGPYSEPLPVSVHVEPETTFAEVVDQVRRGRAETEQAAVRAAQRLLPLAAASSSGVAVVSVPDTGVEVLALTAPQGGPGLEVTWWNAGGSIAGRIADERGTLPSGTTLRLADALGVFLAAVAERPTAPVAELSIVSAAELELMRSLEAGPTVAVPEACVHELIEATAARIPDAPAVEAAGESLSFRELDERANRLAHRLLRDGVGRGDAVGICMHRSAGSVVALLAAMKAGAAYVPLNFEHPAPRLAHQLEQAGAAALVTEESLLDRLPELTIPVLCLDRDADALEGEPATSPGAAAGPDDLAYVLYTSGSTGLPKGVEIRHRNLVNYTTHLLDVLGGA